MNDGMNRRTFIIELAALGAFAAMPATSAQEAKENHINAMMAPDPDAPKVSMLIYPNMIALDLIGPMTVFKIMRWNMQLIWKEKVPLSTDVGIPISANTTFTEAWADPDVFFVPGGLIGTIACMRDQVVLDFVAKQGERAKWITSDCTGSLILGAAGLLQGYNATSNWAVADLLPLLGANHIDQRVVRDRNRITGAGTTAGIDFALELGAKLGDEESARRAQLIIEYSPEPPFQNGTPAEAGPDRVATMRTQRVWMDSQARLAAEAAGRNLKSK